MRLITIFVNIVLLTKLLATTQGGQNTNYILPEIAQGSDPQFVSCNSAVASDLVSWAQSMSAISASVSCDTGTITNNNCKVAGVPVDSSCSESIDQIASALRNIRGQNGVGCLNQMNSNTASALIQAMKAGAYKVCCNQCSGDNSGDTAARGTCAVTTTNAISLNVLSLNANDPASHCAGRYRDRGLEATLFHELLHTAGVYGFRAHPGTMFNHPQTEVPMDERDVIADPIYGCQNFCYGDGNFKNSTSCFACSLAEPVVDGKAVETASWDYLVGRLNTTWQRANEGDSSLPRQCLNLWQGSGDYGRTIGSATLLAQSIHSDLKELEKCSKSFKSDFMRAHQLIPSLNKCKEHFVKLHTDCNNFVTTLKTDQTRCVSSPSLHFTTILQQCDRGRSIIQNSMITSMIRFATDRSSINCQEWFPEEVKCTSGNAVPTSLKKCLQ